jgi:kumamolisin
MGKVFYASRQQPAVPAPMQGEVTELGRILSYHTVRIAKPPMLPRDVPKYGLTPTQLMTRYNAGPLGTTGRVNCLAYELRSVGS